MRSLPSIASRAIEPRRVAFTLAGAVLMTWLMPAVVWACPFCGPAESVTRQMGMVEAAAIVRATGEPTNPATRLRPYYVEHVLKGADRLDKDEEGNFATVRSFSPEKEPKPEDRYLIYGADDSGEIYWSAPLPLTARAVEYLTRELPQAPPEGVERLRYFVPRLRHPEQFIADDAYAEFARTEYDVVQELRPYLSRKELREWIEDEKTNSAHRRLYLTLLGLCATKDDAAWLRALIPVEQAKEPTDRALDALVACYLTITGEEGLEWVEQEILRKPDPVFADVNAAVLALRFHGEQEKVIPRERLAASMRLVLDHPQWVDTVVADLARWKDWSALDRLVEIYRDADEQHRYVRVPIVQYMKACPLPEAKEALKKLEAIDPQAVRRANSLFLPFGAGGSGARN